MMTVQRWQQVKELFHSALERAPQERPGFLAEACLGDAPLRAEVESLIASHESESGFLDAPAYEVAASLLLGDDDLLTGRLIGHYKILELLGRGGMGEIYLAEDAKLDRKVALKLLPAQWTEDTGRLSRFQREARAASALNHPNILTIYEIGESNSTHYIATEFIEGETLRQRMKAGMQFREALEVAIQIASALYAAHEAGIIHRDIKPDNVMVRRDGYVKVLDFGLAKLVERPLEFSFEGETHRLSNTQPGVIMGTVQYMSPEQARGLPIDVRTDIWSLGCILYEMLAGQAPFNGPTATDVLAEILHREPPPLRDVASQAPAELEWIVRKALRKDREERYQTARELLGDLRGLKETLDFEARLEASVAPDSTSVEATHKSSEQRTKSLLEHERPVTEALSAATTATSFEAPISRFEKRRSRAWLIFATLIGAVLVAASIGAYRLLWSKKASLPFDKINVTQLTASRNIIHVAISPDGKYIAYVVTDREQHSLWLRQVSASNDTLIVAPAPVGFWGVTFSRDGNEIYYVTREENGISSLYRVPSLGGTPRKLMSNVDSPVSFSPDGRRMVFARGNFPTPQESALVIADVEGKAEQTLAVRRRPSRFYPAYFTGPSWSPDGQLIACAVANPGPVVGSDLFTFSASDGTARQLTSQNFTLMGRVEWLKDMSGLVMVASQQFAPSLPGQIWYASYPGGETRRVTNDLNDYRALSLTADSTRLVTVSVSDFSNIWVAPEANAARAMSVSPVRARGGLSWTPDGRVVYSTETGSVWDIWIMNKDGSSRRQLTNGAGHNVDPVVSMDGRYIAFVSNRSGEVDIWRMDIDGSNPKQLTKSSFAVNPTFSPDGRWIVFISNQRGGPGRGKAPPRIWKISVEGGEMMPLSDKLAYRPTISPDGRHLAFFYSDSPANAGERYHQVAIIPFEGGETLKVFEISGNVTTREVLRWTPDGRALLYNVMNDNVSNIWKQPVDGGPPVKVTDFKDSLINDFDWARDGSLVCTRGSVIRDVIMITDLK